MSRIALAKFAAAKRASAGRVQVVEDYGIRSFWVPRLAGVYVYGPGNGWQYATRAEAVAAARWARDRARISLEAA
jgi:hypothetical protein